MAIIRQDWLRSPMALELNPNPGPRVRAEVHLIHRTSLPEESNRLMALVNLSAFGEIDGWVMALHHPDHKVADYLLPNGE
ncbi:hypothetical protein Nepgr_003775 [Nepenthes gracilis]|uniref:Uncharacterized protein n=1 Tax=Nepenthes gracilis TaxID=150966 RepID=A0AAD3XEF3_NEPGR|nr:hypothetical protein Nepgr_003775 [Nepenthes gracilis]